MAKKDRVEAKELRKKALTLSDLELKVFLRSLDKEMYYKHLLLPKESKEVKQLQARIYKLKW